MEPARNVTIQELNFEAGPEDHYLARFIDPQHIQHIQTRVQLAPWLLTVSILCITAGLLITFNTKEQFTSLLRQRSLSPLIEMSTLATVLSASSGPIPTHPSAHIARDSIREIDFFVNASSLVQESTLRRVTFLQGEIEATQFAIQLISTSQTALAEAELGQLQAKLDHLLQEYNYLQKRQLSPQSSVQSRRAGSILRSE